MAKRFIDPNWKVLRTLPEELQRAWFYIWDKADTCGVYHYDNDYLKLDLRLNEAIQIETLATLPECEILPGHRILIKNFLVVNYVQLKPGYNPHKPAFRDIEKNQLILNSSLNQACLKLEEEGEEEGEDEEEEEGEDFGKSENLLNDKFLVSQMCKLWYQSFPKYTSEKKKDFEGMGKILMFITDNAGLKTIQDSETQIKILNTLQLIADQVNREPFWLNKPIKTIANNIQEFYNKIKNPQNGKTNGKAATGGNVSVRSAFEKIDKIPDTKRAS